jgi:hypothetical protein
MSYVQQLAEKSGNVAEKQAAERLGVTVVVDTRGHPELDTPNLKRSFGDSVGRVRFAAVWIQCVTIFFVCAQPGASLVGSRNLANKRNHWGLGYIWQRPSHGQQLLALPQVVCSCHV